ncbi:Zinc finger FYVE domain-containing 9 [Brachionus plicatilis]|uniref:Zinc finger FYVE domain-containing 9 n=1 Tax=Brachionus plicatilis TaxID=10195 RepID=A0A3M7PQ62_BRAPC|nr:Zinc finger FYVE domain-containing 9 [Brachionus plicatilis]
MAYYVLDKTSSNRRKNVRFSDGLFPGQSTSLNENNNLETVFDASDACFDEYKAISQILENNQDENVIFFKPMGNLRVNVTIKEMNNCGKCWIYVTNGMCVNAQDELVFILKPLDSQFKQVPRQILYQIMDIYEKSSKGCRVSYMNHMLYNYENEKLFAEILRHNSQKNFVSPNTLLENKNNSAFFYFRPTKMHIEMSLKKIEKLLPKEPYVIGYLIQKWEVPWAKLFPLRLMLRFGEQFESYPCPIVSDHDRKPVYGEIGHSIMSLLSDVRNFQYTIPQIDGINIVLDGLNTSITIPESQYDLLMKSLLTSNDYVFSFASLQINEQVSSYLIAAENENLDSYSSKKVDFNSKGDQKTGVCFVVFNGAFKKNATQNAKQAVIEDGLMVHIDFDTMKNLKQALQSMQPFRIECSKVQSDHVIDIEWQSEDNYLSRNVSSIIDGRCLQGVKNLRLANSIDYKEPKGPKAMKWSQIYLIKADEETQIEESSFNLQKFIEIFSSGCCVALSPMLNKIAEIYQSFASGKYFEPFRIGVRVEVNKDQVGYCLGMYGHLLNDSAILESMDNNLVQILHQCEEMAF